MKVKERSERRWRGGAVRAVKSQGGGAVARWRSVRVSGRRWAGGLAWVQLTWLGVVARRLASDEADADHHRCRAAAVLPWQTCRMG